MGDLEAIDYDVEVMKGNCSSLETAVLESRYDEPVVMQNIEGELTC